MGDPPHEVPNEVSDQNLRCRICICLVPAQINPWILQTFDVLAMGLFLQAQMPFLGLFQDTGEGGFAVVGTLRFLDSNMLSKRHGICAFSYF